MKAYWMILAVFFLCTGFGTSFNTYQSNNYRGLASQDNLVKIDELEQIICDQNKQISNLEAKIEELIASSEETIAAVEKEVDNEVDEDKKEEEEEEVVAENEEDEEVITPQYVFSAAPESMNSPSMMMFFMMIQQQASQMTMFQSQMAEVQSMQSSILAAQTSMMGNFDKAFSDPLLRYSQYPAIYNFGNSYGAQNNNGMATQPTSNIPDINRFPGSSYFHSIPLRQAHMHSFAPVPASQPIAQAIQPNIQDQLQIGP